MKKILSIGYLLLAINAFAIDAPTDLDITDVWARPTLGDTKTTAVYMKIANKGKDDYLVSASTDVAKTAELHQTVIENEVAKMVTISKIAIPALNTVNFEPGGIHIMLFNAVKDLKIGETFDLKLHFENGGDRIVKVLVQDNKNLKK
jgi:copper(I)-binding protein